MIKKAKNYREIIPSSKELVSFSIFLVIAIGLWFVSVLGNISEDEISINLEFYNFPKEKILYSVLPKKIDMLVSATGFTLLKYKFKSSNPKVKINLEKVIIKENNQYKISKSTFHNQIEKQLGRSIKIKKIYYFDYDIDLTNVSTKEVDVIPDISLNLSDQFHLKNSITVIPSKIKIYGEQNILDTINYITTEKLVLENLKSKVNKKVELKRNKYYNLDMETVEIIVDVEQITEKSLKIPISIINMPDSINIQIFPENITVNFTVGFSKFDIIKPDFFSAQINYKSIDFNNKFANIRLTRYPKGVSNVRFLPKKVEYLINKKK